MYKVYCDNFLLYADSHKDYKIVSPKLELELSKAGKFEFSIYPNHPHYGLIRKMKSIISVYHNDSLVFRGRVLNSERGWINESKVTCEGELAFFNDSIIRPYDYISNGQITVSDFLAFIIGEHNSQVDGERQFKLGTVTVVDGDSTNDENLISRSNSEYSSAWETISKSLVEMLGGYLIVRHESDGAYIDYLADINVLSSQTVEFGKNLTDVIKSVKGEDLYTGIIPLGAKDEEGNRITIASVNGDLDYLVNEDQAAIYGRIFKTMTWDDVTEPANLLTKAQSYLSSIGMLTETIDLKAVDISPLNDDINSFRLGTKVRVHSAPHGINETFTIEKLSIDLMKPESNKLTLGATRKTFTEQSGSTSSEIISIGQKVDSAIEQIGTIEVDITSKVASDIEISAESILQSVSEEYYAKGDVDTLLSDTRTEFEQTNDSFEFRFSNYEADLQSIVAGTDAEFEEIKKYIRFVDGNILLGEEGNELTLKIQNNRIAFLENEVEVAYFSDKKLHIMDADFINSLQVGNFGFFPRANGNLSFKKVGE